MSAQFTVPSNINCPGALFLYLYAKIGKIPPEYRSSAAPPKSTIIREIREALELDSGSDAVARIARMCSTPGLENVEMISRVMITMQLIDRAFYAIHPRAVHLPPVVGTSFTEISWLRDLSVKRRVDGVYAKWDGWSLIPRGPLIRAARQEDAASADSVADRFAALGAVPQVLNQDLRTVRVMHKVISASMMDGVGPSKATGSEVVAFIPIAEGDADIHITERGNGGNYFVSFGLPNLNPAEIALAALKKSGYVDIAILPELMMPMGALAQLVDGVGGLGSAAPRVLVAGSGDTSVRSDLDMPWNESSVVNSFGTFLWKQRKIWPAGFSKSRADALGLKCEAGKLVMEANASSDELIVVDIDTLGRCMVLICQDMQANPLAHEAVKHFQPDWVFAPILDSGITVNRWVHTRLFELSSLSQARYLVASSTALAAKLGFKNSGCGMALGPRFANDDPEKQYVIAQAKTGYAIATWRDGSWRCSNLS